MSDEPMNPMDRTLTANDLYLIFETAKQFRLRDALHAYVNVPTPKKPEPKEGELWLCKTDKGHMDAVWRLSGGWSYWSDGLGKYLEGLTPIKRLIPPEDERNEIPIQG